MEKRTRRETKKRDKKQAERARVGGTSVEVRPSLLTSGGPRPEVADKATKRSCYDCVFCISDMVLWLRTLMSGFPVGGQCANHPDTPGQVRPVPGTPCRNFRGKPYRAEPPQPPNDKIRYIPLTRGLFAIVDAEDYEWLSQYKWQAHRTPCGGVYAVHATSNGQLFMHRMIMNPPEGKVVDHINGNGLDNRRCNLRICTQPENCRNSCKHADGKSRFIGVHPHRGRWDVVVTHERKDHYGGSFADEVEAAKARDRLAIQLHGKYARLNFPPETPEADGQ